MDMGGDDELKKALLRQESRLPGGIDGKEEMARCGRSAGGCVVPEARRLDGLPCGWRWPPASPRRLRIPHVRLSEGSCRSRMTASRTAEVVQTVVPRHRAISPLYGSLVWSGLSVLAGGLHRALIMVSARRRCGNPRPTWRRSSPSCDRWARRRPLPRTPGPAAGSD